MEQDTTVGCILKPDGYSGPADIPSLGCLAQIITNIISIIFAFLGAVTLLMLLWGAIQFIISGGDPKALQSAQKTMTFAIIGAVVVLGAYIIISIITDTFGISNPITDFRLYINP